MATDPFHTFASTVRSSLAATRELSETYNSLASASSSSAAAGSSELITAQDRLNDALEALQQDVEDVRQSVAVVKRSPERFGVDVGELRKREEFLRVCEAEVEKLQRSASVQVGGRAERRGGHSSIGIDDDHDDEDHNTAFEKEQQQLLMTQQDTTLSTIGRTLTSLKSQASTMGNEITEQVELIGALDSEVDSTQGRLGRAMGKMDELVRRGDDRLGGWCVWLLVVALFFLLLIAILI
ncbi:hypothetical protein BCV69DRAFT_80086 [Microstroma glucosiphilum]|uniref:t-SNARE coiled-coil homology domain-containing protein n=1 Tax=Pseudomicrostroma glucosiphilum TaxID=1684307 RepID=A0A316U186_9BASI|nr:hypothetical protein BCV69DRAFT_80086 [Pseudomicrostroma glucosiphilum]PWN18261.1 hypothetical protein BCV69DRAFT_80086 [Pseudomicrostroma glucosiphilum]